MGYGYLVETRSYTWIQAGAPAPDDLTGRECMLSSVGIHRLVNGAKLNGTFSDGCFNSSYPSGKLD